MSIANPGYQESYALIGDKKLFLIGGSAAAYQAIVTGFDIVLPLSENIALANHTRAWDENAVRSDDASLMVKVADYVPPVKEKLEFEQLKIDTYYRMIHVPDFFLKYFNETFMIEDYTCNNYTGKIVEYTSELDTVYSCFCNNGDYH